MIVRAMIAVGMRATEVVARVIVTVVAVAMAVLVAKVTAPRLKIRRILWE